MSLDNRGYNKRIKQLRLTPYVPGSLLVFLALRSLFNKLMFILPLFMSCAVMQPGHTSRMEIVLFAL